MERQYSDMTIEELIDHALKYSSRISETDAVIELSQRVLSTQRALDAEREKVKELECYRALWKRRDDELTGVLAQLATFKARVTELERDNAAMKQLFDANPSALWGQLATLQAQLRQVEHDAETYRKMHAVCTMNLALANNDLATLRQLVEVHTKQLTELTIIPIGCSREQELRWTQSIKDLRATLAAKDAGKGA